MGKWTKGWWFEQCHRMDGSPVSEWTVYADEPGHEPDNEPRVIAGVFVKDAAPLIAAAPAMAEALEKLCAEVNGMLGAFEHGMRDLVGNANYDITAQRVVEGRAALASAKGTAQGETR